MNWVGGGDTFLHKGTKLPVESQLQSAHLGCQDEVFLGTPVPRCPSGVLPHGGEGRPPSAFAQEGKSKQWRLHKEGGGILWAKGPGTQAGHIQERPRSFWARRQLARWEAVAGVLPVPWKFPSEWQPAGPQQVGVIIRGCRSSPLS